MMELPKPVSGRMAPRPKLASTIVLLREHKNAPQILMGKRSKRHDFMPDVYVFPGGRVDPCDSYAPAHDHPNSRTRKILETAMLPARARACTLAAVRETFEETSLILGKRWAEKPKAINDASWKAFHGQGYLPNLFNIEVFGRAITPPHCDKRFDTWFFLVRLDAQTGARAFQNSAELVDTNWFTIAQIKELKTHRATDMMIGQLEIYLGYDTLPPDIFYSRAVRNKFKFSRFPAKFSRFLA
ncbi:MAG: NUDIX hydrolase [Robiginitomaculum sp.]